MKLVSSDPLPVSDAIAAALPGAGCQRAALDLLAFTVFLKEHWRQL